MKEDKISGVLAILGMIIVGAIWIGATLLKFTDLIDYNTNDNKDKKESITLNYIVDKFNNSNTIKSFKEANSIVVATATNNGITVDSNANGQKYKHEILLNGNILSFSSKSDDLAAAIIFVIIIDSTQQFYGVPAEESFATANSDVVKSYTLEKDGMEIKTEGESVVYKLDISKKINLVNPATEYIKETDLSDSEYIKGDGSVSIPKGNLFLQKNGYDNEAEITIYEKNQLTDNSYKSIISVITVIFNKDVASDFSNQYSSISLGNKTFGGYKIEINPKLSEFEEEHIVKGQNYKWIRVTIDKSKITG